MNTTILNRQGKLPDDGYYHIEAKGEHINHRSRVVLIIDDKAVQAIANRFAAEATEAGEGFPGQQVDKDHLSHSEENSTEAMGWNKSVINRADGLYAKVNWTPLGRPLIQPANAEDEPAFKFFSTEYDLGDCEKITTRVINKKAYDVVRPLRLDGLALTNKPNNKGQHPISNRRGNPADAAETTTRPTMKNIMKLLGLAEDASEESAVTVIQKIQNRATTAEGQVTTLTKERDELQEGQIEATLEKHKAVIKNRDSWKAKLKADYKGTVELLDGLNPVVSSKGGGDGKKPITNRADAQQPNAGGTGEDAEAQAAEARAAKIQNRARELRSADKSLTLSKSYEAAEAEIDAATAK